MNYRNHRSFATFFLRSLTVLFVTCTTLILSSCPELWGTMDDPADPQSPTYQGFETVDDINAVKPAIADAAVLDYMVFSISKVLDAEAYRLELSTAADFALASQVYLKEDFATNAMAVDADLVSGTTYYWRAGAKKAGIWSAWTPTQSCTMTTIAAQDDVTTTDTTPTLEWTTLSGAVHYEIQLADSEAGLASAETMTSTTNSYTPTTAFLVRNTPYYWHVRASNASGTYTAWSVTYSFEVVWDAIISGMYPANNASVSDTTPLLDWADVTGATGYEIQISATEASVTSAAATAVTASNYQISTALSVADFQYWRVRAKNADGVWSAWSAVYEFVIYVVGSAGPAGGLIFYDKGSETDGWRYLEAAPSDQSTDVQWCNGSYLTTGATATIVGTGEANTATIVTKQGNGIYAAKICQDLVLGGYDDWFLPSKDELDLMYDNLKAAGLGGFASDNYWSSSEYGYTNAWNQYFPNGGQHYTGKYGFIVRVRAIRAF